MTATYICSYIARVVCSSLFWDKVGGCGMWWQVLIHMYVGTCTARHQGLWEEAPSCVFLPVFSEETENRKNAFACLHQPSLYLFSTFHLFFLVVDVVIWPAHKSFQRWLNWARFSLTRLTQMMTEITSYTFICRGAYKSTIPIFGHLRDRGGGGGVIKDFPVIRRVRTPLFDPWEGVFVIYEIPACIEHSGKKNVNSVAAALCLDVVGYTLPKVMYDAKGYAEKILRNR